MTSSAKPELFIDVETYSPVDIKDCGLYPYTASPAFEIMLIQYAFGDDEVSVIDLVSGREELFGMALDSGRAEKDLRFIADKLTDPNVIKIAHNCAFERAALERMTGSYMPPEQWQDTMILAAQNGLPMSLDAAGAALGIEQQKMKEGVSLISYFCKPCKPTIANGGRTRNLPVHAPDRWETFKAYGRRDVEAMRQIYRRLRPITTVPAWEERVRCLDARINERGVLIDTELASAAVEIDEAFKAKHTEELARLTGLENPNSISQLKGWLETVGLTVDSLSKTAVAEIKDAATDPTTRRVLSLRQQLGKTSTQKYSTMLSAAGSDHRVRGITQYYGAARTGRWAGRLVQLQNLPQNHLDDIATVREIVRARDLEGLELLYDSVPDTLSQLIRTALIAKPGHTFLVADYSAIEARVIAYLAGETWRQEVFRDGGDIYCASASKMFKVPVEKHGVNGHLRQKGKIAELALGYGGGVGALVAFGADKMGLTDEEMQEIVTSWRVASPMIPLLWKNVEKMAKEAICNPGRRYPVISPLKNGFWACTYRRDADALRCVLPSGRVLTYWGARIDDNGAISFMGQNQTTRKWEPTTTWGGKLVENIVQAFARDCLAVSMLRLEERGYHIVFHVHDEIIAEEPDGSRWQDMANIMALPIDWAPGLLLRGDGYETKFYMKD